MPVAATQRCYWVTFSAALSSPAGTRYTKVICFVDTRWIYVRLQTLMLYAPAALLAAVSSRNIIEGLPGDLCKKRQSVPGVAMTRGVVHCNASLRPTHPNFPDVWNADGRHAASSRSQPTLSIVLRHLTLKWADNDWLT
jgi:hypothetical protein